MAFALADDDDAAKNEKDLYGLRYAEFIVPLVKAVQELSNQNDSLKAEIGNMETEMAELKAMIVTGQSSVVNQQQIGISPASLEQNIPNPFKHLTTINYTLPQQSTKAEIIITDKSGKTLKAVNVSGSGKGALQIDAVTLFILRKGVSRMKRIDNSFQYCIKDGRWPAAYVMQLRCANHLKVLCSKGMVRNVQAKGSVKTLSGKCKES